MLNPDTCSKLTIVLLIVILALVITLLVKQKSESYKYGTDCLAMNQLLDSKGLGSIRMVPSGRKITSASAGDKADCIIDPKLNIAVGSPQYNQVKSALRCNENSVRDKCL